MTRTDTGAGSCSHWAEVFEALDQDHSCETILNDVQRAPDYIQWTTDTEEFNISISTKKNLHRSLLVFLTVSTHMCRQYLLTVSFGCLTKKGRKEVMSPSSLHPAGLFSSLRRRATRLA